MHHPILLSLAAGLCALFLAGACSSASSGPDATSPDRSDAWLAYLRELQEGETSQPHNPHLGRARSGEPARQRSRGLAAPAPAAELEFSVCDLQDPQAAPRRTLVLRFPDRIQLTWPGADELWSFERNPVAPDELSGVRVHHASRFLIDYTDSDLYSEGIIDGWARLAQVFVSPEELDGLRRTSERVEAFGLTFDRWVAGEGSGPRQGGIIEMEWNEAWALPLRVVRQGSRGLRVQELVRLDQRPDKSGLLIPEQRWPDYGRKDLSDWREDVHDCGGHTHGDD